jgi:hypothetical protein
LCSLYLWRRFFFWWWWWRRRRRKGTEVLKGRVVVHGACCFLAGTAEEEEEESVDDLETQRWISQWWLLTKVHQIYLQIFAELVPRWVYIILESRMNLWVGVGFFLFLFWLILQLVGLGRKTQLTQDPCVCVCVFFSWLMLQVVGWGRTNPTHPRSITLTMQDGGEWLGY